jgi:enamine deaminase RidA (YjgF/YER057c/UK114 family)
MTSPIEKLREYGYELPKPNPPVASYVAVTRSGNLLYISGQLSTDEYGVVAGRLGDTMNVVQGANAAERSALNVLAHVVHTAGVPLERVARILKITVLVAATADFTEHHLVANGASELLVAALGDTGKHARAAFGVPSLPLGAAVEIDAIVEVEG